MLENAAPIAIRYFLIDIINQLNCILTFDTVVFCDILLGGAFCDILLGGPGVSIFLGGRFGGSILSLWSAI